MPQMDPRAESPAPPTPMLALPSGVMARFWRLMNHEGWHVDLPRMGVDTAYAYECLATAHTSGDERLRHTALALFGALHRNAEAPVVH